MTPSGFRGRAGATRARRSLKARAGSTDLPSFLWLREFVGMLPAARLAHSRRDEDHGETICARGQAKQRGTIGPAHADLHHDDSRLSATPAPSIQLLRVNRFFHILDKFNHAQRQWTEHAPTQIGHDILQMSPASDEVLDLFVSSPQLGGVHPECGPAFGSEFLRRPALHFNAPLCLATYDASVGDCGGRTNLKVFHAVLKDCGISLKSQEESVQLTKPFVTPPR